MGLVLLAGGAPAEVWRGQAHIRFEATSTLHNFTGEAPAEPFEFVVRREDSSLLLGGTATVAVARLDTRHAKRDQNMRRMLDAERHPFVVGMLEAVPLSAGKTTTIPLRLTIRETTQTLPAVLENAQADDRQISFDLRWTLSLRASGLQPPVILGFIKVGDTVSLHAHVELQAPDSNSPPS